MIQVLIEAPFEIAQDIQQDIESKVNELEVYTNRITKADVFFKLDDGTKPDVVLARVQLRVPGPEIIASESAEDYLPAFIGALNKAKQQLLKRKDIRQNHHQ